MIDKYSEVTGEELAYKLNKYIVSVKLDFPVVKQYLPLCSYASKMMEGKTEYQDVLVIR